MDRIDCKTVVDRLPAWLDGELAAADRVWLEQHLDRCAACTARASALSAQQERLAALAPTPAELVHPDRFWAAMDHRLGAALDQHELQPPAPRPPRWPRVHAVGLPALVAYAAAMAMLLAFGARQTVALVAAHAEVQRLQHALERAAQADTEPAAAHSPPPDAAAPGLYKTVVYTPERGHF